MDGEEMDNTHNKTYHHALCTGSWPATCAGSSTLITSVAMRAFLVSMLFFVIVNNVNISIAFMQNTFTSLSSLKR